MVLNVSGGLAAKFLNSGFSGPVLFFSPSDRGVFSKVSGSFCNCLLPESIQITAVRHLPDHPMFSGKIVPLIIFLPS